MLKIIKQNWITCITLLFSIIMGILLLANPSSSALAIIVVAGILFLAWGIFDVIKYFRTYPEDAAEGFAFFSGITMIAVGLFCFFGSGWFIRVFPVLAVLYGLFQILIGFRKVQRFLDAFRAEEAFWYLKAISAGITLLFGFLIVLIPNMSLMSIWVFTGLTLIIEGIFDAVTIVLQSRME